VGQEIAVAVAKHDIGDDLGLGGVLFDLAARPEAIIRADARQEVIEAGCAKARPLTAGKQDIPGDDQDILASTHAKSLIRLALAV
jgi:hypothetical protein